MHPRGLPPLAPRVLVADDAGVDLVSVLRAELARQRERVDVLEQALATALATERARATRRKEAAA